MAAPRSKKFAIPTLEEIDDSERKSSNIQSTFKNFQSTKKTKDLNNQLGESTSCITSTKSTDNVPENSSHVPNVQQTVVQKATPSSGVVKTDNGKKEETVENFPTLAKLGTTNSVIVNPRQRGNPILKHIRNIPWEYGNIIPDYVMGQATCALFLSLRYHQLHPNYIHDRLKSLGRSFDLRVLLVQVDLADPHHLLKGLSKICILADCTLMLAFTAEEAGRYLETYKVYENKPPDAIMEKTDSNFMTKLSDCFTMVKSVNKTDCTTLISSFKSVENIMKADKEDLGLCPGFGPQKAKRLYDVLHEPFLKKKNIPKNTEDQET
ncbi:DNA excision repair protein ERCC-1 isoform X1 [Patella vulgata]|uniref:DNA excision repair protein ERCC-1 isoform X1 n=1 Tax=Patella vulgata TaxID=6465 RepID=UPI00217F8C1B|nr:DNA excision repair protein ERCC-1 isoform X1 [Patella vulgata]